MTVFVNVRYRLSLWFVGVFICFWYEYFYSIAKPIISSLNCLCIFVKIIVPINADLFLDSVPHLTELCIPWIISFLYCWVDVVYVFWILGLYQIDDLHISLILCAVLLPSPCLLEALLILNSRNIWRTWHFLTSKETLWIKYRISLDFFFNFIQNLSIVLIVVFLLQCSVYFYYNVSVAHWVTEDHWKFLN